MPITLSAQAKKIRFISFCLSSTLLFSHTIMAQQTVKSSDPDADITIEALEQTPYPEQTLSQRIESRLIHEVIESNHLLRKKVDKLSSPDVQSRYLETLDPGKFYFLQSDVDTFSKSEKQMLNHIRIGQLEEEFKIFNTFRDRVEERIAFALTRLDEPFDFELEESLLIDREDANWSEDTKALDNLWRQRLKNDILNEQLNDDELSYDEIIDKLKRRYLNIARRIRQQKSVDVFQTIINAYSLSVEPHTAYLTPRDSENFDINMRLSLIGIGAELSQDEEYTVIRRIIPGGPAAKDGRLKPEERIIGVGQTDDEIEDTVGQRLDDVVDKIRGKKGSKVTLEIIPGKDDKVGKPKTITLTRDEIRLEEKSAQYTIKSFDTPTGETRIGIIDLDSFYIDFDAYRSGKKNYRSTTRDVKNILEKLKKENIDGVVIDLRSNGGGGLPEAISLAGLFIESGPVVQIQYSNGEIDVEKDPDPNIVYTGPLAVLIDQYSASASEIFAGAIKDYQRGIIIGEPTFGKGTVQSVSNLDRNIPFMRKLGRINFTTAQFFRVNGSSTQLKGVEPDIAWPTVVFDDDDTGERSYENAIPWREIKPSKYLAFEPSVTTDDIVQLERLHTSRIEDNPDFNYRTKIHTFNNIQKNKKMVTLNKTQRQKENDLRDMELLAIVNEKQAATNEEIYDSIQAYQDAAEEEEKERRLDGKPDFDNPFLIEGAMILADYVSRLASSANNDTLVVDSTTTVTTEEAATE